MIRLDAQNRIYERDERGQTVAYIDALRALRRCYALVTRADQRGYERGLAEGRRREQQVHREMYYADHWAAPKAEEAPADAE